MISPLVSTLIGREHLFWPRGAPLLLLIRSGSHIFILFFSNSISNHRQTWPPLPTNETHEEAWGQGLKANDILYLGQRS